MAKDHKYHRARAEIDTGLRSDEAAALARHAIEAQRTMQLEYAGDDGFVVLITSWAGVALIKFMVEVEPVGERTHVSTAIAHYWTSQSSVYFIPIGPKTMEGYREYLTFMRELGELFTAADPSTLVAVIETDEASGLFDGAEPQAAANAAGGITPERAAELVLDPSATPEQLAEIAAEYPTLRWYVRLHPACYEGLTGWIDAQEQTNRQGDGR